MDSVVMFLGLAATLYLGLALIGGWAWIVLRRVAPEGSRPPAVLLGIVLAQFVGWYWSATLDRGLFGLWPGFVAGSSVATVSLAAVHRASLWAALRRPTRWAAQAGAGLASIVLFAIASGPLVARTPLTVASPNNDVASYANVAQHISHHGLSSPGPVSGFDLGHLARVDVYGEFNLLSLAHWITERGIFEIALPLLAVVCALIAQIIAGILRRATPLPTAIVIALAVVPQSTFLFAYIVTCYFGSQLLGLAFAMAATAGLFSHSLEQGRPARAANIAGIAAMFVGLTMTYAHMLVLFMPVVTVIALLNSRFVRGRAMEVVRAVAAAIAVVAVLEPQRLWFSVGRAFVLGRAEAGWPLPGILPSALIGFQRSWEHTVTPGGIIWSALLIALALGAFRVVSRQQGEGWRLPTPSIVALGLASYVAMYLARGGPDYKQWKWIAFLQPLLCVTMLAPIAGLMCLSRRRTAGIPVLAALMALIAINTGAAGDFRRSLGHHDQTVSSDLANMGRDPQLADVEAINVDLSPYWESMWAASALAPRTIYLLQPTYYGVSDPVAEWTLIRQSALPPGVEGPGVRWIGTDYALVKSGTRTNARGAPRRPSVDPPITDPRSGPVQAGERRSSSEGAPGQGRFVRGAGRRAGTAQSSNG